MDREVDSARSIQVATGPRERVAYWLLLGGNRLVVAGGLAGVTALAFRALIWAGYVDVGPGSHVPTVFASGLLAGVATLLTIALSINQLVISRVFGAPDDLRSRLSGTRALRDTVESLAGEPSSPNDPAAFLSLVASTLHERALALGAALEADDWDPPEQVTRTVEDVAAYAENIDRALEAETRIIQVLDVIIGTAYAENMTAVDHLRDVHEEAIGGSARAEAAAVADLLEAIAVSRQFLKTLALHQDFGTLTRLIVYSGVMALLVTVAVPSIYGPTGTTVPSSVLPALVSLSVGVALFPFAVFVSYVVRSATIARQTVSVGPFLPPDQF